MKYVGIAALAATFWLSVATLRLMIDGGGCASQYEARVIASPSGGPIPPRPQLETIPVKLGRLTRADVAADMDALEAQMTDCADLGTLVAVDLVIGPRGWVRSADVRGKLAGTRAGHCVEAHVYSTRFPPSEAGLTTSQAFRLR